MAKIIFDENKVTLFDMRDIENGRTFEQQIDFIKKFVVSDDGTDADPKEAYEFVGSLSVPRARELMREFWRYMAAKRESAVNPQTPGS